MVRRSDRLELGRSSARSLCPPSRPNYRSGDPCQRQESCLSRLPRRKINKQLGLTKKKREFAWSLTPDISAGNWLRGAAMDRNRQPDSAVYVRPGKRGGSVSRHSNTYPKLRNVGSIPVARSNKTDNLTTVSGRYGCSIWLQLKVLCDRFNWNRACV